MKKLLTGLALGASVLVAAPGAYADGMPGAKKGGVAVHAPCAVGRFHGFYLGAHVGSANYDWSVQDRNAWVTGENEDLPSQVSGSTDGFVGGAQVGYNWQARCTVFGVEADFSWVGIDQSKTNSAINGDSVTFRSELNWLGTLKTKTGIVVDNMLFYVTGGLAYADIERRWNLNDTGGAAPASDSGGSSDTRWGYIAGIGTEWAVTPSISIVGEASYIRFTDWSADHSTQFHVLNNGNNRTAFGFDNQDSIWTGRIGVNFKFGSF